MNKTEETKALFKEGTIIKSKATGAKYSFDAWQDERRAFVTCIDKGDSLTVVPDDEYCIKVLSKDGEVRSVWEVKYLAEPLPNEDNDICAEASGETHPESPKEEQSDNNVSELFLKQFEDFKKALEALRFPPLPKITFFRDDAESLKEEIGHI
jgi:hypothetical protein